MLSGAGLALRPYQSDMLSEIDGALNEGCETVMGVLPTGSGKTAIMALWAKQQQGKILFIAPNLAIIGQLPDEFAKWGLSALPIGTGHKTWNYGRTWSGRLSDSSIAVTPGTAFNNIKNPAGMKRFSGLIVDESHHAPDAPRGKATRTTRLVQMARTAGIPVLGMTATPWRLSKRQGFQMTWDTLIVGPSWNELRGKYLSDIHMIRHGDEYIRGAGAASGKDYTEGATWTRNARNPIFSKGAFDMLLKHAMLPDGTLRKTIMYAVGQKHALNLAKLAAKHEIETGLLLSSPELLKSAPKSIERDRHEVNRRFRNGEIRLVINVDMISEGYDLPDCDVVIILRPTMSLTKWLQMCGRGSRLTTGKDTMLLIDLTDNHERLGDPLMERAWSLEARSDSDDIGDPVLRFCADEKSGSCNTMIYTGQLDCPHCGRRQGIDCDKCGKFRHWDKFATGEGYIKWTCDRCQHEDEIAAEYGVMLIFKGWTRKGDLYYGLHLSDNTRANVFSFQRGPFMMIDRAYRQASKGDMDQVEPVHKIIVETKWSGKWQNVIRSRYVPSAILEDTKI